MARPSDRCDRYGRDDKRWRGIRTTARLALGKEGGKWANGWVGIRPAALAVQHELVPK